MILVDSNVWIDLIQKDNEGFEWSLGRVQLARSTTQLYINPVIYAELAPTFDQSEFLKSFIDASGAVLSPLEEPEAYLAGRAFQKYRGLRGGKMGVLPDFFIGAQAQVRG